MISSILLPILLLASLTLAIATSQIDYLIFNNPTCTGAPHLTFTYPLGECQTTVSSTSYSYYINSAGDSIIAFAFSSGDCAIGHVTESTLIPAGCGSTGTNYGQWILWLVHINGTNPSPPISFPPTNWLLGTQYLYSINSSKATTCSNGDGIKSYNMGSNSLVCQPAQEIQPGASKQTFCSSNQYVSGQYSDANCTNLITAQTGNLNACKSGRTQTCPSGGELPSFDNAISVGFTQFDNSACASNLNDVTTLTRNGTCLSRSSWTCGQSKNDSGLVITYNTFFDLGCTQLNTFTEYPLNTCIINDPIHPDWVNRSYTCSGSLPNSSGSNPSHISSTDLVRTPNIGVLTLLLGTLVVIMNLSYFR